MQRIINAIAKGQKEGLYSLEEVADILKAIDQVGAIVQKYNKDQEEIRKQDELCKELEFQAQQKAEMQKKTETLEKTKGPVKPKS